MSRRGENESLERIRRADAAYTGFPELAAWVAERVDLTPWEAAFVAYQAERGLASPESLHRALEFAVRAAAIDTGAIEGLYRVDRGFTFSVAAQAATWEVDIASQGPHVRPLFEAQLAGLELVIDAVTTRTPISEAWIRRLHEVLCGAQETYAARTPVGHQQHPLPKGVYKGQPNHVLLADGTEHSYCPVERTGDEMHRLVLQLDSEEFTRAHPILQAAFAHYSFVAIHPFADGNGRVARALASVFTYRACSLPLVVLADQKSLYLGALAGADAGRFDGFTGFVLQSMVDTANEIVLRMRESRAESVRESADRLHSSYARTQPSTARDLDVVAARIAGLVRDGIERELAEVSLPAAIETGVVLERRAFPVGSPEFRSVKDGSASIVATLRSSDPVVHASRAYQVAVSRSSEAFYALHVEQVGAPENARLPIRLDLVHPSLKSSFRTQLDTWVRMQAGELLREARRRIEAAALRSGRG